MRKEGKKEERKEEKIKEAESGRERRLIGKGLAERSLKMTIQEIEER